MLKLDQKGRRRVENKIGTKNKGNKQKPLINMVYIQLNNHFKCQWSNYTIKAQRLSESIKNKTQVYVVYKKPSSNIKIHKIKCEGMKKDIPC